MPDLNTLLERRANTWEQFQEVLERARSAEELSAEDTQTLDRMESDLRSMTTNIERLQRANELETQFETVNRDQVPEVRGGDAPAADEQYRTAFLNFCRFGAAGMDPEERKLVQAGIVPGNELRAAGVGTGSAGGYLVPQGFRQRIIETEKFFASVRQVADHIETATGNTLPWPTVDDTANEGAILAENTQVTEQDVTLGTAQLGAYMYTSKLVRVSLQLLQDSVFDVETFLVRKLGQRLGRIQNRHFTVGTGSSQPLGVQTNATVGKTGASGQTTSVTYDDLIDLIYSVDPAYRGNLGLEDNEIVGGSAQFMLHDLTIGAVRKLKDSQGHPLWQPSLQAGVPDTLLGYTLVPNNYMPQMAAGVKSILFGNFTQAYVVRDVTGVGLVRFEERYMDFLQVAFLAFQRSDATLQDASAVKAYANAAS